MKMFSSVITRLTEKTENHKTLILPEYAKRDYSFSETHRLVSFSTAFASRCSFKWNSLYWQRICAGSGEIPQLESGMVNSFVPYREKPCP